VLIIEHWGTLEIIEFEDDLVLPYCTYCLLLQKRLCQFKCVSSCTVMLKVCLQYGVIHRLKCFS